LEWILEYWPLGVALKPKPPDSLPPSKAESLPFEPFDASGAAASGQSQSYQRRAGKEGACRDQELL
jgi:hypothetical protein